MKDIKKSLGAFVLLILFITGISVEVYSQDWLMAARKDKKEKMTFAEIQEEFNKYMNTQDGIPKSGWSQFKRWEWFAEARLDEKGYFDPSLNWKGWVEKKERFGQKTGNSEILSASWTQLGPVVMPSQFSDAGIPGMGRINCITFNPNNPREIWVGSPSGGLWKSIDDGESWNCLSDNFPNLGVSSILINPLNTDIMYIATGDGDAHDTYSIGVMKSIDGGQTWNPTGLNMNLSDTLSISKMLMHPSDPETILAVSKNGIYKTTNGGNTWQIKQNGIFRDIEVDPINPNTWYSTETQIGIYKSTDSGNTWVKLTTGLPESGFTRIGIAICKTYPNIIFAVYVKPDNGFFGLYRTNDGGATWTICSASPNLLGWDVYGNDSGGQGWYDLTIGVHPNNPDIVYIGGVNFWKSIDGGITWKISAHWYGARRTPYIHADQHDFIFHPQDPNIIYSGNDGGLFKSSDNGTTWIDRSNGLAIHQVYRMGVAKQNANMIILGTQDNGTDLYNNGKWQNINGGDGMECIIDPVLNNIMYSSVYYGTFYKSVNTGYTWNVLTGDFRGKGAWITPFLMHPKNPDILYVATTKIFKSINKGETWTALSTDLTPAKSEFNSMAISPSNPNYIYVATRARLFSTSDDGANWKEVHMNINPAYITSLTVHPLKPQTVFITIGRYYAGEKVYQSDNGGETWTNISGNLPNIPANCLILDPVSLGIYVGTDLGVFYTYSSSIYWQSFDTGLPNVVVNQLAIDLNSKKIRAATYGRGIWESPLAETPAVFPPIIGTYTRHKNQTLILNEYIDVIKWTANPQNATIPGKLAGYKIYRVTNSIDSHIATANASALEYLVRKVANEVASYAISAFTEDGKESTRVYFEIGKIY